MIHQVILPGRSLCTYFVVTLLIFFKMCVGEISIHENRENVHEEAVIAIAKRYTQNAVHLFVTEPVLLSNNFVATLGMPSVINITSLNEQRRTDAYIVLSQTVSHTINILESPSFLYKKELAWILAFQDDIQIAELRKLFEAFFKSGILNVVAVSSNGSSAYVHTYYPFLNGCYNYEPVLIDVWVSNRFERGSDMFPNNKMNDLRRCLVKVVIFVSLPRVLFQNDDLKGDFAKVFGVVRENMNFVPIFHEAPNDTVGVKELYASHDIIGFGRPDFFPGVSHGNPIWYDCYTWCLPTFVRHFRGFAAVTNSLKWDVWLISICTFVVGVIIFRLLLRHADREPINTYPSWLIFWGIVVEAPLPSPKNTQLRLIFASFFITFLVIGTAFKARLHVLMTSHGVAEKLLDLPDVYSSPIELFADPVFSWMLGSYSMESDTAKRVHYYNRFDKQLVAGIFRGMGTGVSSCFTSRAACHKFANQFGKTSEGFYKLYPLPVCAAAVPSIGFSLGGSSPFLGRILVITRRLWENGIAVKLATKSPPKELVSTDLPKIGLDDINSIFYLFLLGLGVCSVVFLFEQVYARRNCLSSQQVGTEWATRKNV